MNDSEKRRKRLLSETRNLYSDRSGLPAVHPRYGAVYHKLYAKEETAETGTFGIRLFVCVLLFAAFVTMDIRGLEVRQVGSDRIVSEITADMDVGEVWNSL